MRARFLLAGVMLGLFASACLGQSKAARLQESAQNLNTAMRFGRVDIATELVAEKSLPDFVKHHQAWGRDVRLIDVEFQGIQPAGEDALVFVTIGWQRLNEQDLRVTQLMQKWQYGKKGWRLTEETRAGGDVGLLGEKIDVLQPEQHEDVHFRSITIR